jgi:hypothetical protein
MMPKARRVEGARWAADLGVWTEVLHRFASDKLAIQPGLRGERFGLTGDWVLDPRVTLRQQATAKVAFTQSSGRYHQPALATSIDYQLPGEPFRASSALQASAGVNIVSNMLGGDVIFDHDQLRTVELVARGHEQAERHARAHALDERLVAIRHDHQIDPAGGHSDELEPPIVAGCGLETAGGDDGPRDGGAGRVIEEVAAQRGPSARLDWPAGCGPRQRPPAPRWPRGMRMLAPSRCACRATARGAARCR